MGKNWKAPLLDENHSKHSETSWVTGRLDTLNRKIATSDPSSCPRRHIRIQAMEGHPQFFGKNLWYRQARVINKTFDEFRPTIRNDWYATWLFFRTGHELDLRLNFQYNPLRPSYTSFNAFQQEKHDACKMNVLSTLSEKILPINVYHINDYFYGFFFLPLDAKPEAKS